MTQLSRLQRTRRLKKSDRGRNCYLLLRTLFFGIIHTYPWGTFNDYADQLGPVAGPVIQANGRLTFEDD
jgi:hypothetical protein